MTTTERTEREKDGRPVPPSPPAKMPAGDSELPRKLPKAPKPRKVEKRNRGRKG